MRLSEREYWNAAASEERAGRMAAEAVNELLTPAEAMALQINVETFGALACARQIEDLIVDNLPSDDVSEIWLDATGTTVWNIYRAYRALGTKVAA